MPVEVVEETKERKIQKAITSLSIDAKDLCDVMAVLQDRMRYKGGGIQEGDRISYAVARRYLMSSMTSLEYLIDFKEDEDGD